MLSSEVLAFGLKLGQVAFSLLDLTAGWRQNLRDDVITFDAREPTAHPLPFADWLWRPGVLSQNPPRPELGEEAQLSGFSGPVALNCSPN